MNPVLGEIILKSSEQLHMERRKIIYSLMMESNSTKFVVFSQKSTITSREFRDTYVSESTFLKCLFFLYVVV